MTDRTIPCTLSIDYSYFTSKFTLLRIQRSIYTPLLLGHRSVSSRRGYDAVLRDYDLVSLSVEKDLHYLGPADLVPRRGLDDISLS